MYYCIACKEVHEPEQKLAEGAATEIIFKTGFHYINNCLYHAGICKTVEETCAHIHSATA